MYTIFVLTATVLLLISAWAYRSLYTKYRDVLEHQSKLQSVVDLISHIPSANSGPSWHILGGLSGICGLSLFCATIFSDTAMPEEEFISSVISISALLIGGAFSTITLGTLWQARRLDFHRGHVIHDFHDLISHLNNRLDEISSSFRATYVGRAQPFHRVYLITTLPFLGELSYPNSVQTMKFRQHLQTMTEFRRDGIENSSVNGNNVFEFHVICGTENAIRRFYKEFYKNGKPRENLESAVVKASQDIDHLNAMTQDSSKQRGPFYRVEKVPPVQFMIVGNSLFEFTLEPGNSQTEVFNTQVVHDVRYCNAYIKNFRMLAPPGIFDMIDNDDGVA